VTDPFDNTAYPSPFDYHSWVENKLTELKHDGSYRYFLALEKSAIDFPVFHFINQKGQSVQAVNWCGNDYLAMSTSPQVVEMLRSTVKISGAGSGGTRNIAGTTIHHLGLENELADWHKKEAALLFNSAYQANQTAMATIGRQLPELIFISDEENHASLIEGMRAVPNKKIRFRHNDLAHLEEILTSIPVDQPKLIVFESVYSISGTLAPIVEILGLAKKYHALTYIDEVHAVGLYGEEGAGLIEHCKLESEVDIINGTLSKAIGVFGGYLAGSKCWMDFFRSYGPGFIFTTSLPPGICAAANASIQFIRSNRNLRIQFFNQVKHLRAALDARGIGYSGQSSHITHVLIGSETKCKRITDQLLEEHGIYIQPVNFPTVPYGRACLRITITPKHTKDQIDSLVMALNKVMNTRMILTGRGSKLSRIQMDIVKNKIEAVDPLTEIQINYKESLGDQLKDIPLHTQDGTDFFTQSIAGELDRGQADLAVHSLKDMSGAHFFGNHRFAVVDRDNTRDLAIFNQNIIKRLQEGKPIRIGTCSFRRETMATEFLSKALPYFGKTKQLITSNIRGNVDTRLKKLDQGEYDGILLAVAGVNRLLNEEATRQEITSLLSNKKIMVLPLIDCVPAPCQGAIVVEACADNLKACTLLKKINNAELLEDCEQEKKIALNYGAGCIQHFGVTTIKAGKEKWQYASGIDQHGRSFEDWYGIQLPEFNSAPDTIIGSDELGFKPFRTYTASASSLPFSKSYFIAHSAVMENALDTNRYQNSRIWTAGTSSWFKLAELGVWVEGCADSMGLNSILPLWSSRLINLKQEEVMILTNVPSAQRWTNSGWTAKGTYEIRYESSLIDKYKLQSAKLVFWHCYAHLDTVKEIIPAGLLHACLPGRTGDLLKQQGIEPVLFPTLTAFKQWKKKYSLSHIAA